MTIKELIIGKEFIDRFILVANEVYRWTGDYRGVFEYYEEGELTEDEIGDLLVYCDKYDLLED